MSRQPGHVNAACSCHSTASYMLSLHRHSAHLHVDVGTKPLSHVHVSHWLTDAKSTAVQRGTPRHHPDTNTECWGTRCTAMCWAHTVAHQKPLCWRRLLMMNLSGWRAVVVVVVTETEQRR